MPHYDEYIQHGAPDVAEKASAWATGIGLQAVDGLEVSAYLDQAARDNIEGRITLDEVRQRVDAYYQVRHVQGQHQRDTHEEADRVATRIAQVLCEGGFSWSPASYIGVHERLFADIFDHAGQLRPYNISKREWVLNGASVVYAPYTQLRATLDYDLAAERDFDYRSLTPAQTRRHLAQFVAQLWQIHPFAEGNTRTTAVWLILYLRRLGFAVDNTPFACHAWYFRNALVRANYSALAEGIHPNLDFLDRFFDNLLFGAQHELRNRELRV